MKRKKIYENILLKVYALLWERSTTAMQDKISPRADCESDIYNNPIKLLMAIKEHSQHYQEPRYEMSIILDSLRLTITLKQRDKENLQEYTWRFKTSQEITESHISGPRILFKLVKTVDKYDSTNKDLIKKYNEETF